MNVHQLEWFCHAFETRSFAKSAERSFVSRQAFGKAIKALEDELGAQLFVRDAGGVEPTELAQLVYPKMRACIKDYQDILRIRDEHFAEMRHGIRFAIADGTAAALPDDFFAELERANPYVSLTMEKHSANRCLDLLDDNLVDFVICSGPIPESALKRIPLAYHDLYVAAAHDLVGFSLETCTLEDLQSLTFFTLGTDFPNDRALLQLFESHGLALRTNGQYNDYDIILKEVKRGRGATIVPANCLDQVEADNVAIIPFPDESLRWEIDFFYHDRAYADVEQRLINFMLERSASASS